MKIVEKIAKKFTKSASNTVKTEVKKTAIDLLPTVIGIVSMVVGILVFKEVVDIPEDPSPTVSNTSITTNNYFFRDMTEESIKKILEDK